jgi:transcriptional regulator with XRE-family HTH domain
VVSLTARRTPLSATRNEPVTKPATGIANVVWSENARRVAPRHQRRDAMTHRPSLGSFLRSRREHTTPADVGILHGGRRRTPGLRREELALLAGISADYLVRLEQDRERRPSAAVLAALSDALRLNELERARLRRLAAIAGQPEMCPVASPGDPISEATIAVLERLDPTPAVVVNRSTDLEAWNRTYDRVTRASGLLHTESPNVARYVFLDSTAPVVHPDWEDLAAAVVSHLQSTAAACLVDEAFDTLVDELRARSTDFDRRWTQQEVVDTGRRRERIVHDEVGLLEFDVEGLTLPDRAKRRLLIYVPADGASSESLETLVAGDGGERLRVV